MRARRLLALGTLALATACGGADSAPTAAPPSPSVTSPTPTVTPTPTRDEVAYLNQVHDELPGNFAFLPDKDLVDLGDTTCRSIDRGVSRPDLAEAAEDNVGPTVAKILLDAATTHLCPEHSNF